MTAGAPAIAPPHARSALREQECEQRQRAAAGQSPAHRLGKVANARLGAGRSGGGQRRQFSGNGLDQPLDLPRTRTLLDRNFSAGIALGIQESLISLPYTIQRHQPLGNAK